ncbi:MAG: DUF1549 and DUF1553 domain-containing protein [Candidatus Sumerlaeia bacterium]|nr:DUF1549 and DUF1553 domain-containing protein [Candidatus Sumerlaeia bacterium]
MEDEGMSMYGRNGISALLALLLLSGSGWSQVKSGAKRNKSDKGVPALVRRAQAAAAAKNTPSQPGAGKGAVAGARRSGLFRSIPPPQSAASDAAPAALLRNAAIYDAPNSGPFTPFNAIDTAVLAKLNERGITPANLCSDEVFIRRVYLDLIGTLPEPETVLQFLNNRNADKRAALVETLFQRKEFADYWALKWCDILRVKAEFPINLWPNAVQAYHRWIHDAVASNMPYDQFARALLTSSGSNFRVPPVNFYRAVQSREPTGIASAVALTFMGTRLDSWPQDRRAGMAAFFSRIEYRLTGEWKEEIVSLNPASSTPLEAVFPDGRKVTIPANTDPRRVFADWLISSDNPWFARSIANRVWYWLMGRGIIHEPDDIRPDNPPANPELLALLEKELVKANYDLRHLFRLIVNSRTYQQSPVPRTTIPEAEALFAYYPVRRLDAEVLIDALNWIGGSGESYESAIPEPFTFIPSEKRTIELADGSISSSFLEMFGRPARDTGLESERNNQPTDTQRLHLLNSSDVQRKIEQSPRLRNLATAARGNRAQIISGTYLIILSRYPTQAELAAAEQYFQTPGINSTQAANDLAWALINSKEFLYRH